MLKRQDKRAILGGGLEAARMDYDVVTQLWSLRPDRMFLAYDTADDWEPLVKAGQLLWEADFTRRHLYCYVLIGHPRDTLDLAERRLKDAWRAGFMPMAMLWSDGHREQSEEWRKFQRLWARPAIIRSRMLQMR
jgi:hypothetical protein